MDNIRFKIVAHNSNEYFQAVALREQVLRAPLGLTFTKEEMDAEAGHIHCVGLEEGVVVACAVLVPKPAQVRMQRVAVLERLRNRGIGSQMMPFCEAEILRRGFDHVYVHARNTAVVFYERHGYVADGDYFEEHTIPHLLMRKRLS